MFAKWVACGPGKLGSSDKQLTDFRTLWRYAKIQLANVLCGIEEETRKEKVQEIYNLGINTTMISSSKKAPVVAERKSGELSQCGVEEVEDETVPPNITLSNSLRGMKGPTKRVPWY